MSEVLEEYYMYKDILTIIKSINDLVVSARFWFKEYIKTMTLKVGFKKCKTDPCLLYRVNKLGTAIVIVYKYDMLAMAENQHCWVQLNASRNNVKLAQWVNKRTS